MKKILTALVLTLSAVQTVTAQSSLVPQPVTTDDPGKINLVANLPDVPWQVALSNIIQIILGVAGSLALISFTVGGVMMLTSLGNEERINKGKDIIFWSIIALIIIAASFAVVLGLTQLVLIPPT